MLFKSTENENNSPLFSNCILFNEEHLLKQFINDSKVEQEE